MLAEIQSIASGQIFGTPEDWKLAAAERLKRLMCSADILLVVIVLACRLGILFFTRRRVTAEFRARQAVEAIVSGLMIFCSVVAIFTTVGIVVRAGLRDRGSSSRWCRCTSSCSG